jgi:hypothetical protein
VSASLARLDERQRALLAEWMPRARVARDLSWPVGATVLELVDGPGRFVLKAGGPDDHHLGRELDAHAGCTAVWQAEGAAARLVHGDRAARLLVTEHLPGALALDGPWATDPDVHRRAGALLRRFHEQEGRRGGADAERAQTRRAVAWLDGAHRISAAAQARLRAALAELDGGDPVLVPTHGDWQPRNWLVDGDRVRVIDFGRFAFRSASSDLARLAAQEWRAAPECEDAFLDGYGHDPRSAEHWLLVRMREAIGTAVWAYQVGDEAFERQGHRMLADVLAELG